MRTITQLFLTLFVILFIMSCQPAAPSYTSFDEYPTYEGTDLGLSYTPQKSVFKVWSPAVEEMELRLYETALEGSPTEEIKMKRGEQGVWTTEIAKDLNGTYYTFRVKQDGQWSNEVPDPYAKACGTNGRRAMVVDFSKTNPTDWDQDKSPNLRSKTDAILYELHVRDASIHPSSGIQNKGKFIGLTETGTKTPEGVSTGLDHMKDLGITHVHLLPSYDYYTVDESKLDEAQFNWGYDPQNYNIPEGSYSTNPEDGNVRIKEFKQMIQAFHRNGIRVIMDVVYNHTGITEESNFNQLVPGYYYRQKEDGSFSDASGCGNETASDRPMMRKFIIESLQHWVKEYHIDGFRFDLMGIHDQETMNQISKALHETKPSILLYGEGWTAGDSPLPEEKRSLKKYTHQLNRVAAFSDDIRDGLKGSVFEHEDTGFASGKSGMEESIKFGVVAATDHPQVDFAKVNYSDAPWAKQPFQCINYVSCHDNHTLYDRLVNSVKDGDEAERIRMHKLANTVVLTAQGIPFLHAGVEFLRTKGGEENSYKSPDTVNQLDWPRKGQYKEVYEYYKSLVQLRKDHPAFRMASSSLIRENLRFLDNLPKGVVGYTIDGKAVGDNWSTILVLYNGNREDVNVTIPKAPWKLALNENEINELGFRKSNGGAIKINRTSALIFMQD